MPQDKFVSLRAVLFDLDGTLIDTADDLVRALYEACDQLDQPRPPHDAARRRVAYGGRGLVELAFGANSGQKGDTALAILLDYYRDHIAEHSRLYEGLDVLLDTLDRNRVPWGIVTNKPIVLTHLLLAALSLDKRAKAIVGADSLPVRKPDPAPLLFAAGQLNVLPQHCVYVGDHDRDIVAAKAAHMRSVGASYGYIDDGDDPEDWQADKIIDHPWQLGDALVNLGLDMTSTEPHA